MKLEWRPDNWGLSSRIVALSLLLLLMVQAAVFSVVRISIEQSAKRQVQQELLVLVFVLLARISSVSQVAAVHPLRRQPS